MKYEMNHIYNEDCVAAMKDMPDGYFDLAIVDPPYFDGPNKLGYYRKRTSSIGVTRQAFDKIGTWDIPCREYYIELTRVSKNQIIWGINYFSFAGQVSGRIVWDKCNDHTTFSKCEIASCNLIDTVQQFRFMWSGMMQGKSITEGHIMQGNKKLNEKRIHPTQKPVALYKWLLKKYAKEGDKILDTHGGSMSSVIACIDMGFDFMAFELDKNYFEMARKRIIEHLLQGDALRDIKFNGLEL